jgi:hypothetical protein
MANCPKGSNPKPDKNIELGGIQGAIERKIHPTSSSVEGWQVTFRIVPVKRLKGTGMLCSRFNTRLSLVPFKKNVCMETHVITWA